MKKKKTSHLWTKDEIKTVLQLWESKTKEEIADKLGVGVDKIGYIATQIRMNGYKLARKTKVGYLRGLVSEAIKEMKKK